MTLELERHGAQLFARALAPKDVDELVRHLPNSAGPGERIYGNSGLAEWLENGPIGLIARTVLGPAGRPARAILFDKTQSTNWSLGWHQDRTIAVRERIDVSDFHHWNCKAGATHVEPPFSLIERMLTVRVHLDPVSADNGPLLIVLGSHRAGKIAECEIDSLIGRSKSFACTAEVGDVWFYRTAILHASDRSTTGGRRRVLQVDLSADDLPGGLEWLGIR